MLRVALAVPIEEIRVPHRLFDAAEIAFHVFRAVKLQEWLDAFLRCHHYREFLADRRKLSFELLVPWKQIAREIRRRRQLREVQEFRTLARIRIIRRQRTEVDMQAGGD